jgi:hypothetical protein
MPVMHYILNRCGTLWNWLLANNASQATGLLVLISGLYCFLTWRMAKAVARQTRAMMQPVVLLEFHWQNEPYYPASYFEIKNLGSQPLLLLDVNLWCGLYGKKHFTEHQTLWDEHIIPPGESLRPQFDFKRRFENEKLSWSSSELSYSLEVVASDLSKQVVLTYRNIPVLSIVNVRNGMPLSVRGRYFLKPFLRLYHRILYRVRYGKMA